MSNEAPPSEKSGCLTRLLLTVLIIAAATFLTALLAVRTDAGRAYIERRLSGFLGTEVTVGSARGGWPLVLVMEKVETKGFGSSKGGGFRVKELRVGPALGVSWRVTIKGAALYLAQDGEGRWLPEFFAGLGDLPSMNVADIGNLTSEFREEMTLHAAGSSIQWLAADGAEIASAGGVQFDVIPLSVPKRRMSYYLLSVSSFAGADGVRLQEVEREWLSTGTNDYIEIGRGGWPVAAAAEGFWGPRR